MGQAQVLEGTTEEIIAGLQEAYPEQTLRVTVESQEEDLLKDMPPPPGTIRSEAHLIALLKEGLAGSRHEVTEETWARKRLEVRRRLLGRLPVAFLAAKDRG